MIDEKSVGELFTIDGKDVWRCVSYCALPSAEFVNLDTGEKMGGAAQSSHLEQFNKLIEEKR